MGDWWDEYLGYFGDSADTGAAIAETGTDIDWSDIASGVGETYDEAVNYASDYSDLYSQPETADTFIDYDDSSARGDQYARVEDGSTNPSEPRSIFSKEPEQSMFGQASDFINKNQKLTDMAGGLIKGAWNDREQSKKDKKEYERKMEERAYNEKINREKEDRADARRGGGGGGSSAMEMLAAKEAIDAANKAKFSQSITGLRPVGLINKGKKLTYIGGKPVYNDNGLVA